MSADVAVVLDVTDLGGGGVSLGPHGVGLWLGTGPSVAWLSHRCISRQGLFLGFSGPTTWPMGEFLETSFLKVSGDDWKLLVEKACPFWDVPQAPLPLPRGHQGLSWGLLTCHPPGTPYTDGSAHIVTPPRPLL